MIPSVNSLTPFVIVTQLDDFKAGDAFPLLTSLYSLLGLSLPEAITRLALFFYHSLSDFTVDPARCVNLRYPHRELFVVSDIPLLAVFKNLLNLDSGVANSQSRSRLPSLRNHAPRSDQYLRSAHLPLHVVRKLSASWEPTGSADVAV